MNDELPEGWVTAALGQATELVSGAGFPEVHQNRSGLPYPFFKVGNLGDVAPGQPLVTSDHTIDVRTAAALRARIIPEQAVVFAKIGMAIRLNRRRLLGRAACIDNNMMASVPSPAVEPRYLLRWLETVDLMPLTQSTTVPSLRKSDLAELQFPLPPLAEQGRIVAAVEALLARVNAAKERLDRVPGILKRARDSVLVAGCSGRLTEDWRVGAVVEDLDRVLGRVSAVGAVTGRAATDNVILGRCILSVGDPQADAPPGWRWLPLAQVARLESGHTPSRKKPDYWNGGVPWIGLQDAREHHGRTISDTRQNVSHLGLQNSAARLLPAGTVCLSRTASVGYVVIMGRAMATSQDFVNWVCSDAVLPEFLMYALMAEGDDIRAFGRGTTHTTIYFPEVKALHICLPPPSEQKEIGGQIRRLLAAVAKVEAAVGRALRVAGGLPRAVLAKAFRGELVPTEAALARQEGRGYESAEELLARVQRERDDGGDVGVAESGGRRQVRRTRPSTRRRRGS